jgi:hypothetical protein
MSELRFKRQLNLKDEGGLIAADFLFAFVLMFSFFTLFFAFTMALSFIELTQYVTYSVARTHMAGHLTPELQKDAALRKYQELQATEGLRGLFSTPNWIEIRPNSLVVGDFNTEYTSLRTTKSTFHGARLPVRFRILEVNFPLFGSTTRDEDGLTANVQTFLLREPTVSECEAFMTQRLQNILNRDSARYRLMTTATGGVPDSHPQMVDNGC